MNCSRNRIHDMRHIAVTRIEYAVGLQEAGNWTYLVLVLHDLAMRRGLWMRGRLGNWLLRWRRSHVGVLREAEGETANIKLGKEHTA